MNPLRQVKPQLYEASVSTLNIKVHSMLSYVYIIRGMPDDLPHVAPRGKRPIAPIKSVGELQSNERKKT